MSSLTSLRVINVHKVLGEGSFGHVFLASNKENPAEYYALKCIETANTAQKIDTDTVSAENRILNEVAVMKELKHPNIVRLYSAFNDGVKIYIVMEYCPCGTLSFHIDTNMSKRKYFSEEIIRTWVKQLISALTFIHRHGVMHRDIKSENIYMADFSESVKLGDFGISKFMSMKFASTCIGSWPYLAPEVFHGGKYTVTADVWSLGIVLHEMAMLQRPFKSPPNGEELEDFRDGLETKLSTYYSQALASVILRLITDSKQRITLTALEKHEWFKKKLASIGENVAVTKGRHFANERGVKNRLLANINC